MPGKNIDADYDPSQGWNIDHVYDMGEYTRNNIGERDLMVYMCFDDNNNGDGYIGEATLSTVCLPSSTKYKYVKNIQTNILTTFSMYINRNSQLIFVFFLQRTIK